MPLLIHPASCCDVCLETFTYDEPKPPHALPCGHIFCKDCLDNLRPALCPICRRRFHAIGGGRKLITGTTEIDLQPLQLIEKLMLKRNIDPEGEEWKELNEEVDKWFNDGNTNEALTEARQLLAEKDQYWLNARSLRRDLRRTAEKRVDESSTANAMIASLNMRVEELERQCTSYQTQVEGLQWELQSYRTHNPMPRPPRDYRVDYFPAEMNAVPRTNGYLYAPTNGTSTRVHTPPRQITDGNTAGTAPTTPTSAGSRQSHRDYDNRTTPVASSSGSRVHHVSPESVSSATPTPSRARPESATRITIQQGPDSRFLPSGPRMNGEYGALQPSWPSGVRAHGRSVSDPFGPPVVENSGSVQPRYPREENARRGHHRQESYPSNTGLSTSSAAFAGGSAESSRRNGDISSYQIPQLPTTEPITPTHSRSGSSSWLQESRSMRQPYVAVHHTSNAIIAPTEPAPQRSLQRSVSSSHAFSGTRSSRSGSGSASSIPPLTTEPATSRPHPTRRRTVQIDDQIDHIQPDAIPRYLPGAATMSAPMSAPPSDDHNGRFAPLPVTRPLPDSANSSRRSSIMSWGDSRSFRDESPSTMPIPDFALLRRADEVDSVSDLPLSWFPESSFGDGDPTTPSSTALNFQVADISEATEAMSAMAFYNRQLLPDDGATPRSRPESLLEDRQIANGSTTQEGRRSWDTASQYIPQSATQAVVPERERADGSSAHEYDDFELVDHEPVGSTMTPAANPDRRTPSGSSIPSSRASRQHLLPLAEDNTPSPDPWWTNIRRPPQANDDANALGLSDLATSPIISAPTPITPSHSFLRTYSYDNA